jgi:hypothetical protein
MLDQNEDNVPLHYDTPEFHTDHNVYVLGAGYSASAGLPLMTNFLEKMRSYRSTLVDKDKDAEHIDGVLKFCLDCASASSKIHLDLENIETILSLAAATDQFKTNGTLSTSFVAAEFISNAIASTLEHYQNTYQGNPSISVGDVAYNFYDFAALVMAGKLGKLNDQRGQRNTIITFNYDTLVERSLIKHNVNYSYGLDVANEKGIRSHLLEKKAEEDDVRILKLHGSINWSPGGLFDSYSELMKNPYNDNLVPKPIILPPWWKKDPSKEISVVWNRALDRLRTATRIIFIGYSCPPSDQYMRYLLGAGLNNNISLSSVYVINTDQEAHQAVQSLFSKTFRNVKQVKPMSAQGFFTGLFPLETGEYRDKGYLEEINRAIR